MRIVEIKALSNGAHRNQTGSFKIVPDGYAVIPDNLETPNFPFGEFETKDEDIIEVETIDGEEVEKVVGTIKVVTKWVAGTIPEPTPEPIPESETKELSIDDLATAILEGVNEV